MTLNEPAHPPAPIASRLRRLAPGLSALFLTVALSACGGGKTPKPPPAPPTMKEQLNELERTGELPALDRSTDIAGPDADNNGIRDDIDAYIAALPVTEPVKKAAQQRARVQQRALLIDLQDRTALMALADASMASTVCMSERSRAGFPPEQQEAARRNGSAITFKIEAITANTPERAERYLAYMRALHGTTTTLRRENACEDQ
jgi:hypothetical protein